MKLRSALVLAVILGVPANAVLAQPAAQPPVGSPLLKLPMGARVRLQTAASPGSWMKGVLVGADSASIALVPESSPPLGAGQLVVPTASVGRFELHTGSKRHWLQGLIAGLAVGVAVGLTADVDSVACNSADSYFGGSSGYYCSRGEAIAISMTATGGLGAGVGALVKTDRWTPVALDALAPPPARVSGVVPHLRARPGGGAELGLTIGF